MEWVYKYKAGIDQHLDVWCLIVRPFTNPNRTIIRRFRESLNWADNDDVYGVDVNAADHWLKSGWNVGVFYWNQVR